MSDLDRLIASRDELLEWVATCAPIIHDGLADGRGTVHTGPFSECDDPPCATAHMAMVRAYEASEGEYAEPAAVKP